MVTGALLACELPYEEMGNSLGASTRKTLQETLNPFVEAKGGVQSAVTWQRQTQKERALLMSIQKSLFSG